jgi:isopentenyl-diphosphate Delta-isomerase
MFLMSDVPVDLILVDLQDKPYGVLEKHETHFLGLTHRAFSVILFRQRNGVTQTLLQRRSYTKYHTPGLWSNTCCSHAKCDERIMETARNRLTHEVGLSGIDLSSCGHFHYRAPLEYGLIEDEIDHVFVGYCDIDEPLFNVDEVAQTLWLDCEHLVLLMHAHPIYFTPWFALLWAHLESNNQYKKILYAQSTFL